MSIAEEKDTRPAATGSQSALGHIAVSAAGEHRRCATAIRPGGQDDEMGSSQRETGADVGAVAEPVATAATKADPDPSVASETNQRVQ